MKSNPIVAVLGVVIMSAGVMLNSKTMPWPDDGLVTGNASPQLVPATTEQVEPEPLPLPPASPCDDCPNKDICTGDVCIMLPAPEDSLTRADADTRRYPSDLEIENADNKEKPILRVFTSVSCAPCVELQDFLDGRQDIMGFYNVEFYDYEDSPQVFTQYNVERVPTSVLVCGSHTVDRKVGFDDGDNYVGWLNAVWKRGRGE